MVNDRHKISLLRAKVTDDEFNLVSSIPNLDSIKSLITTQKMSQTAKYNAAFRLSKEFRMF